MRKKSQISVEFMFALGMILFIFLMLLGFMFNRRTELRGAEIEVNRRGTCLLVSSLITSAFVSGDGTAISGSIAYGADISGTNFKELYVGDINCWLSVHDVPDSNLLAGNIKIENQNNDITIQNV